MERKPLKGADLDAWLEAVHMSFDYVEAYAYMSGGDVLLRLDPKLILIKIPDYLGFWDFIAYLRNSGAQIIEKGRAKLRYKHEFFGCNVTLNAKIIHKYGDKLYIAVAPAPKQQTLQ